MHIALLPKASVAIHVGGNALHEYTAESEHPMKATSYVETIDGDEFSVVLKLEPNFTPRYAVSRDDSPYDATIGSFAPSPLTDRGWQATHLTRSR
jgi:hypothetical protein